MQVTIDSKIYVDTQEAAKRSGYSREHIRRLAREGQIESEKQGTLVFLSLKSLMAYRTEMDKLGTLKHSKTRS
jgi:excisionase family DNA binding protein